MNKVLNRTYKKAFNSARAILWNKGVCVLDLAYEHFARVFESFDTSKGEKYIQKKVAEFLSVQSPNAQSRVTPEECHMVALYIMKKE